MQISFSYVGGYCAFPDYIASSNKSLLALRSPRPCTSSSVLSPPKALIIMAAASSGSKQRHAQSFSGSDEVLVEGGERQFPALREFQIGSVVQGEPVAFSEPGRGRPCLVSGFRIQRDGQAAQKARKALPAFAVNTLSTFGHQEPVQGLRRPQGGSDRAGFSDAVQKIHDGLGVLVLEAPSERNGIIDDEAHGRPSLTRSLILRPRSMTPLLASRRPSAARFAFLRSNPGSAGTSRATAFPWRVITISAPCSTWSRRALNLFFASNDPISRTVHLQLAYILA